MTLSTTQPLANRHDVARTIFRYGPSTAALIYPLLLVSLHQSGRHFVQATDATGKLLAGLAVGLSAALVYSVRFSASLPFRNQLVRSARVSSRISHSPLHPSS